jgi:hypothetical protein
MVLSNLLSWLPPRVALTDRDGDTSGVETAGSLNFFLHLIGESGAGKTRVKNVAQSIVEPNVCRYGTRTVDGIKPDLLTAGTGEGLLKHFVSAVKDKEAGKDKGDSAATVMTQFTDVGYVAVDEVSNYVAELARPNTKAPGVMTSLWSGQDTGTNTSSIDSRASLPAHAVRLVIVVLAQPELCAALLTDELIAGGTPQRPLWLPAEDWTPCPVTQPPKGSAPPPIPRLVTLTQVHPAIGGSTSAQPAKSINELPFELNFPRPTVSPPLADMIWIKQPKAAQDYIAAFDAAHAANKLSPAARAALSPEERRARKGVRIQQHAVLVRLKVTAALALLHARNRTDMQPTDQDWELAGVVMRVCLGMLAAVYVEAEAVREIEAHDRGVQKATELDATNTAMESKRESRAIKVAEALRERLFREGPLSLTQIASRLSKPQRDVREAAIQYGEDQRWFTYVKGESGVTGGNLYWPLFNGNIFDPRASGAS